MKKLLTTLGVLSLGLAVFAGPAAAPKFLFDSSDASEGSIEDVNAALTVTPLGGTAIKVETKATKEQYPGFSIQPTKRRNWDLSPWGWLEARLTNVSTNALTVGLRIDENGRWDRNNAENVYLRPGETRTVKIYPGYQYGHKPGYPINFARISQLLVFPHGGKAGRAFIIDEIKASGAAGDKPKQAAAPQPKWPVDHDGKIYFVGMATDKVPVALTNAAHAVSIAGAGKGNWRTAKVTPRAPLKGWNMRQFTQVDVTVTNPMDKAVPFMVQLASPSGFTRGVSATLATGETTTVSVPFQAKRPFVFNPEIKKGMSEKEMLMKHSGTPFESNRMNALIFSAENPFTTRLVVERIVASAPPATLPDWLGKRPPVDGDWRVTFAEEFDKPLDATRWNVYSPNYWDRRTHFSKDNVILKDGLVKLRYEKKTGFHNDDPTDKSAVAKTDFACGYLDTYGKWTQTYGYWEARMKPPRAHGLWPAFWTMPDRGADKGPQWVRAATEKDGMEFDIFEHLTAWGPHRFNVACHWDGYGKNHVSLGTSNVYLPADTDGFITVGMLWLPGYVAYYGNGEKFFEWKSDRVCSAPSYPILYMVSGGWANTPLDPAALPDEFTIDYLRIWQRADLAEADGK